MLSLPGFAGADVIVRFGGMVSTVNVRMAAPEFAPWSVARTTNECGPSASAAAVNGDVQSANGPASTLHSMSTAVASTTANSIVGVVSVVMLGGPTVMVTSGGMVSTVNARFADVTFVASSVARTTNSCGPCDRFEAANGDAHAANAPPSRLHSGDPTWPVTVNSNAAFAERMTPLGPLVIVTTGPTVSIVQTCVMVVALPNGSGAFTTNVCPPSGSRLARRFSSVCGDVQLANALPSSEHSVVASVSVVNANVGVASFDNTGGVAVNARFGAVASTFHVRVAGVASTVPFPPFARR